MPRKILSKVEEITCYAKGVFSVSLRPFSECPKYRPGQFLHLTLDEYDEAGGFWPESRVFSINSRYGDDTLRILYSVKGKYTSRMERELTIGKECWVKLPYGDFVIDADKNIQVILIAGGTGISPFIPFLRNLGQYNIRRVCIFYGTRIKELLIFRDLLEQLAVNDFRFACKLYVEDGSADVGVNSGRIPIEKVMSAIDNPAGVKIYVSGPPTMISYFVSEIGRRGIGPDKIFVDAWE
jgi:ferredoxin-NADP reductase